MRGVTQHPPELTSGKHSNGLSIHKTFNGEEHQGRHRYPGDAAFPDSGQGDWRSLSDGGVFIYPSGSGCNDGVFTRILTDTEDGFEMRWIGGRPLRQPHKNVVRR